MAMQRFSNLLGLRIDPITNMVSLCTQREANQAITLISYIKEINVQKDRQGLKQKSCRTIYYSHNVIVIALVFLQILPNQN